MMTRSHPNVGRTLKLLTVACIAAFALTGCKAKEAKSGGFIDKTAMKNDASLPFQKVWIKPEFDKSKYTKVYVAPVNTSYMLKMTDWQKGERKDEKKRGEGIEAEEGNDPEGPVAAEHDELTVGDVEDPHDAENEGEARRRQAVEATDQEPEQELLGEFYNSEIF